MTEEISADTTKDHFGKAMQIVQQDGVHGDDLALLADIFLNEGKARAISYITSKEDRSCWIRNQLQLARSIE
jgi:hypothetical protein